MNVFSLRYATLLLVSTAALQAAPDISNINNCIKDVRQADLAAPSVPTFDSYTHDYRTLLSDLERAASTLPQVYQQTASTPLIRFLKNLGETKFYQIFNRQPTDQNSATLAQIIPDAALAILTHQNFQAVGVNAFQEIISDLYDSFLSEEVRAGTQSGRPIEPPRYGVIPPLVKFGSAESGPYTWPCDATNEILGMSCAVVSLPPAQIVGGLLAWTSLGHETGGHDVIHADEGLIDELAQVVYDAVYKSFRSRSLASYWSNCIDETVSDVCGYLNLGPSAGPGLIGYFRALGNGKLRATGSMDDPHPIDLLRGYLAAAVVKNLPFKEAAEWSQAISKETSKDDARLWLVDRFGIPHFFPVSFANAVASTEVVAKAILQTKLSSLQKHSLQDIQNWTDKDQQIVDRLTTVLKTKGELPSDLRGPGFYASYVVASATQAALQRGANISTIFNEMQTFLTLMHAENATWSVQGSGEATALLEKGVRQANPENASITPKYVIHNVPELADEESLVAQG
ncbi:MAG: hypothetical protein Q8K75_07315 [Chlamydiales bacterium]|nr:hypothetical protein [Chlamydiales bacterium]